MNRLLLITGDLATGKTTFSKILSERYSIEAFNKDTIKEILGDTIGFTNREENLKLSHATIAVMTHIFAKNAENGHDCILEANFHGNEIQILLDIAAMHDIKVLTLEFMADEKVLYERFRNRIENENRHPVHQSAGLDSFEEFCRYIEDSRLDTVPGEKICVNATDFSYQTDDVLLTKIDAFMR